MVGLLPAENSCVHVAHACVLLECHKVGDLCWPRMLMLVCVNAGYGPANVPDILKGWETP